MPNLAAEPVYDRAEAAGVAFSWRRGCRGHPDVPAGFGLLVEAAGDVSGAWVDASGTLGVAARAAHAARVEVLEGSAVALGALRRDLGSDPRVVVRPGLPWDPPPASLDGVLLAPPAERGSARVRAELDAAARALRPDGELLLLLHKDLGAKRYEKEAARCFGHGEVIARARGARLSRWSAPRPVAAPVSPWSTFEAGGREVRALAGCYAAGKLDPGTSQLLMALEDADVPWSGATVLDVGCGWGPLARHAADRGAQVDAVDDDLAAVRSCAVNVPEARVHHADATGTFLGSDATFDVVLVNPPFHVGRSVRTEVGRELLRTAAHRTAASGELWWVANRELAYERDELLSGARLVRDQAGFRVFRRSGRSAR